MKERLQKLLAESKDHTFGNNSESSEYGSFGRLSPEMQAWIADVEDSILTNHGRDSAPWRIFERYHPNAINGNESDTFLEQRNTILAALKACDRIIPHSTFTGIDKEGALKNIFDRFHTVARQMRNRYASRPTLDIDDEYDVQDLLHSLLRLHFDDIRSEEWTPSYAGGSARMDFLLKQERSVIEVKKTRKNLGDKELGNQLIEDKERYKTHPDCRRLICFTYDPDGRITNPRGIANDLNSKSEDFEVEVIIKPEA